MNPIAQTIIEEILADPRFDPAQIETVFVDEASAEAWVTGRRLETKAVLQAVAVGFETALQLRDVGFPVEPDSFAVDFFHQFAMNHLPKWSDEFTRACIEIGELLKPHDRDLTDQVFELQGRAIEILLERLEGLFVALAQ